MPAPVVIKLQVDGVEHIRAAFKSIEDIVTKSESVTTKATQHGSQVRKTEAEREAQFKKRTDEKRAQDQVALWKRTDAMVAQFRQQGIRDHERAEKEKTRITERETREVVNMEIAMYRKRSQEAERFRSHIAGAAAHGLVNGGRTIGRVATGMMGTALGLGGGFSISDSMHRSMELSGMATDIAIQGHVTSENGRVENRRQRSGKEIEGAIRATSIETGNDASDVGAGLMKFTNLTGDLQLGLDMMPKLAAMAAATGSSFDKTAQAAGNIAKALEGTEDPAKATMQVMQAMSGQGRENSIELKDFAVQVAKVTAGAGKYEGNAVENVIKLSALMQDARGGGGAWSATSAGTAVSSFTSTFGKGARIGAFRDAGVKIKGEDGKTRDPFAVIADSIDKTKGDQAGLSNLFGSVMALRLVDKHVGIYRDAEKKKKGSGRDAVLKHMEGVAGANLSDDEIAKNLAMRMAQDDKKIAKVKAEFDKAVSQDLLPEFIKLIPVIRNMVPLFIDLAKTALPAFVEFIKSVADFAQENKGLIRDIAAHPIGAIMAAEVTKSISTVALGEVIKKLLGGGAGGGGGSGGGPGIPGIVVAGAAAAAVIAKAAISYEGGTEAAQDLRARVEAWQKGDHKNGVSPEDAALQVQEAKNRLAKSNVLENTANLILSPVLGPADRDYKQYKKDQGLVDNAGLQEQIGASYTSADTDKLKEAIAKAVVAGMRAGLKTSADDNEHGTGTRVPAPNQIGPMGARPGANE